MKLFSISQSPLNRRKSLNEFCEYNYFEGVMEDQIKAQE